MFNISVIAKRNVYGMLVDSVLRHECSRILPCLMLPIWNYVMRNYRAGDGRFKEWFKIVLENEAMDIVLESFAHAARYVIRYSRQFHPRITKTQRYGVLTSLRYGSTHIINSSYVREFSMEVISTLDGFC